MTVGAPVVYCVDNRQRPPHTDNVPSGERYPKNDVERALRYAAARGWTVTQTKAGYQRGVASCGQGCSVSVGSTPKNAGNRAKAILHAVDRCPHRPRTDREKRRSR